MLCERVLLGLRENVFQLLKYKRTLLIKVGPKKAHGRSTHPLADWSEQKVCINLKERASNSSVSGLNLLGPATGSFKSCKQCAGPCYCYMSVFLP